MVGVRFDVFIFFIRHPERDSGSGLIVEIPAQVRNDVITLLVSVCASW